MLDLKFGLSGVKRWVVKYYYSRYCCGRCNGTFNPEAMPTSRYGPNLRAYVIHQAIELRVPQLPLAASLNQLFGLNLNSSIAKNQKKQASHIYKSTYDGLLSRIIAGKLIHADETKIRVDGRAAFVWVLTNLEEVVYFYTETREGEVIQALLREFDGVLVSDFYAAYGSIDCPQQKCLVHLIRDLNDDLLKQPFNAELKTLVGDFASLLKPAIQTVDRFGLKSRFLRKHKVFVNRFYRRLDGSDYKTEIGVKWQKRLAKNRDTLFTFLDYDGVPWNNNNAEHAIKAFATIRKNINGLTSARGIREYLILLSICQTCKYKGVSFLNFLRSGCQFVDDFVKARSV